MRPPTLPAVLLLAACSPSGEPTAAPALSFSADGGSYVWSVAKGARGGLILGRTSGTRSTPVLVITCDNLRTGGLQASLFSADPAPASLVLTAGEAVMSVPARGGQIGDQPVLEGEGDLPPDWAGALGAARTLELRYGDQGVEVQGPGPAQADAFGRYCRDLEARAR
jgi:hypothetical protein